MLKRLIINQKTIPVPVPLKTLEEVCSWIDEILVPIGETVTSATLDGKDILDLWCSPKTTSAINLHSESRLEVRIESPEDLALQSLDAIHSLAGAILRGIKALAVHLWTSRQSEIQPELHAVREDVGLICELMERMSDMGVADKIDIGHINELHGRIGLISTCLDAAMSIGDWKGAAQILLRDTGSSIGLETSLKELVDVSEASHLRLLTGRKHRGFPARAEGKA
jgi:hypothetical protein